MGVGCSQPSDDHGPTKETTEWALLRPSEKPDLKLSLKLGLDPSLPIITQVYHFEEILGRGAFGEVVLASCVDSDRKYAIKKLDTSTLKCGDLRNEITILKECRQCVLAHAHAHAARTSHLLTLSSPCGPLCACGQPQHHLADWLLRHRGVCIPGHGMRTRRRAL